MQSLDEGCVKKKITSFFRCGTSSLIEGQLTNVQKIILILNNEMFYFLFISQLSWGRCDGNVLSELVGILDFWNTLMVKVLGLMLFKLMFNYFACLWNVLWCLRLTKFKIYPNHAWWVIKIVLIKFVEFDSIQTNLQLYCMFMKCFMVFDKDQIQNFPWPWWW